MNPWKSLRGLPRGIWILAAATFVNRVGTMALPFLVLYLTESRQFPVGAAATVVALYGAAALVTAPLAGWLCDRFGALGVMRWSLLLSGAVLAVFPLADGFVAISAVTVVWSALGEAFRPASLVVTADLVRPDQRKSAFALMRLMINLGFSIGPAVGGLLATVSYGALFIVDGATSILAGVFLTTLWRRAPSASEPAADAAEPAPAAGRGFGPLAEVRFLLFLAALIPVQVVFFQFSAVMPLFLVRELSFTASSFGMLMTVNGLVITLLEVPLNAAMERWCDGHSLSLGALLIGLGFGALTLVQGPWGVVATVVVWTFGEMILFPSASAHVANHSLPERRGQAMGLLQMTFSLSFALAPWLGTASYQTLGARLFWMATFGAGLASAALLAWAAACRTLVAGGATAGLPTEESSAREFAAASGPA